MIKPRFYLFLICTIFSQILAADTSTDWFLTNSTSSYSTDDLDGIAAWQDFSEKPVNLDSAGSNLLSFSNGTSNSGCTSSSVSNQIVVNADASSTVNIESVQTTTGSDIKAECNTANTLLNMR